MAKAKIKIEELNSNIFKLGGKAYPKGMYIPEYNETSTDAKGLLTNREQARVLLRPIGVSSDAKCPFKNPRPWSDFVDARGKRYVDFATFTESLLEIISKT
tara:strand:+ start:1055 stop:1357 length:303 start_codon:yes stop_codon:yes gene_type:complete